MPEKNSVAVIVRTKDRSHFLKRALSSIFSQTRPAHQVAIINDGGSRSSVDAACSHLSPADRAKIRILDFHPPAGRGIGAHINRGLHATESDFFAVHDDDDSWEPRFLEKMVPAAENFNGAVCKSTLVKEKVEGESIITISRSTYQPWLEHEISLFRLAESLTFPPIAMIVRRSVLERIGYFKDDLGPLEDWEFCLRLLADGHIPFLEENLANYHQREMQDNGSDANSFQNSWKRYAVLDGRIRNELLREDLRLGRVGLGFLVNLAQAHGQLFQKIHNGKKD